MDFVRHSGSSMLVSLGIMSMLAIGMALGMTMPTARRTSCGIGRACDACPRGYYSYVTVASGLRAKVCCPGCKSRYFTSGSSPRPFCRCDFDAVVGDCWKGEQCASCNSSVVGSINQLPVCCQNCEESGLALCASSCNCRHNGPGA